VASDNALAGMTLPELQAYIVRRSEERGFTNETAQDKFALLVEEVGELAKAMRPLHGIKMADDAREQNIEYELADVFWMLLSLSASLGVDLETAVLAKEAKNQERTWL